MRVRAWVIAVSAGLFAGSVHGTTLELSPSVAEELLSKTTTLVLNPPNLETEEFKLEWVGKPIDGVEARIVSDSLQWVRVSEVLVLPRARAVVTLRNASLGKLEHAGYSQTMISVDKMLEGEIALAMLSGEPHHLRFEAVRGGEKITGAFRVKHVARAGRREKVFFDSSCSSFHLETVDVSMDDQAWAYVGCRLVYTKKESNLTPSFDVLVYWHGVGQNAQINGVETKAASASIWALRLRSAPGKVVLQSAKQSFSVSYRVPNRLSLGSLGLGVGPYTYLFKADGDPSKYLSPTGTAVATIYGSFFFTEYMRLVLFSAMPLHRLLFVDNGIYLLLEQTRFFDNRITMNLLLGGHGIVFPYQNSTNFRFSFPQGVELIASDLPFRRHRIHLGAFLYPRIDGRSYNNVWIRWAYGRYFGEFNFISWDEAVPAGNVSAQVAGVSFGFPLFQFL